MMMESRKIVHYQRREMGIECNKFTMDDFIVFQLVCELATLFITPNCH